MIQECYTAWLTPAVTFIIFLKLILTISTIIRIYSLVLLIRVSTHTSAVFITYIYEINNVSSNRNVKVIIHLDPGALKSNDSIYNIGI